MKVDSLTVLAPVRNGQLGALGATLEGWPADPSPLGQVPGTHMARFLVVPHLRRSNGAPLDDTAYLLFGAEFDGPYDQYVDALVASPEVRAAFAHCAGAREDGDLRVYLEDYRITPGYSVVAYPNTSLDEVQSALELRRRVAEFAIRARGLRGAELKREWLATF